jgi:hypothetical protein
MTLLVKIFVPTVPKVPITQIGVVKVVTVLVRVEKLKKLIPVELDSGGDSDVDPFTLIVREPSP